MTGPTQPQALSWADLDPVSLHGRNLLMQDNLRATLTAAVARLWSTMAPYNRPESAQFSDVMAPISRGATAAMSTMTAVHLHQLASVHHGALLPPAPLNPHTLVGPTVRGVPPAELWLRPFITVWWRLAQGDDPATARQQGLDRALTIALTELQLAKTHTAAHVLPATRGVTGYRRITRGDGACALCTGALGPYPPDELMPIHDRCSCDIDPVLGDTPVEAADVAVEQHTELGPVLAR